MDWKVKILLILVFSAFFLYISWSMSSQNTRPVSIIHLGQEHHGVVDNFIDKATKNLLITKLTIQAVHLDGNPITKTKGPQKQASPGMKTSSALFKTNDFHWVGKHPILIITILFSNRMPKKCKVSMQVILVPFFFRKRLNCFFLIEAQQSFFPHKSLVLFISQNVKAQYVH